MIWTVRKPTDIEVKYVKVVVPVLYGIEDMPSDFPGRENDHWTIIFDIDTGQIDQWPGIEFTHELCMKVRDRGTYHLLDASQRLIGLNTCDGVPDFFPGKSNEYIDFVITPTGLIQNWPRDHNFDFSEFSYVP